MFSARIGKTYLGPEHDYPFLSGTREFISKNIFDMGSAYSENILTCRSRDDVQSPVDDLESFWWVMLWAAVFNAREVGDTIYWWEQWIRIPSNQEREIMVTLHFYDYQITTHMRSILLEWNDQLGFLARDWRLGSHRSKDTKWCIANYRQYASRGASESLRLILDHQEKLSNEGLSPPSE